MYRFKTADELGPTLLSEIPEAMRYLLGQDCDEHGLSNSKCSELITDKCNHHIVKNTNNASTAKIWCIFKQFITHKPVVETSINLRFMHD